MPNGTDERVLLGRVGRCHSGHAPAGTLCLAMVSVIAVRSVRGAMRRGPKS